MLIKEFLMASLLRPARLMLLDDHDLVLQGMLQLLRQEQDMEVVGHFIRSRELIDALSQPGMEVDIIIMDYTLSPGEIDGLNLIRGLRLRFPDIHLLIISASHTPATVALALRCGAKGFIGKDMCSSQLAVAVRRLVGGRGYLHPQMESNLQYNGVSIAQGQRNGLAKPTGVDMLVRTSELSFREREVLRCCLDGMSVTQIALKFERSVKTISTQKQAAFKKLGLRSDNELFKIRSQFEGD
jgi:DNA-binding NarL/FixJ family response regulator